VGLAGSNPGLSCFTGCVERKGHAQQFGCMTIPISRNPVAAPSGRVIPTSDRLSLINEALINTSNNTVNVYDDTSSEWIVANSAFEQIVPELYYLRDWNFATSFAELDRVGDSQYPGMTDEFAKPADCMFLQNVWRVDDIQRYEQTLPPNCHLPKEAYPPQLEYKVLNDHIHTRAPYGVKAQYTPFPQPNDEWSFGFRVALRKKIEAAIYRSLNENLQAASAVEKYAEEFIQRAVSRDAQERPGRAMFKSPLYETRWKRRVAGYWR